MTVNEIRKYAENHVQNITGVYYFSDIEWIETKKMFKEHIYCAKYTKKRGFQFQEIMRAFEDGKVYCKNILYNPCCIGSRIKIIFEDYYTSSYYGYTIYQKNLQLNTYYGSHTFTNFQKIKCYSLEELIKKDERLKYCGFKNEDLDHIDFFQFLLLYRKYPAIEVLIKLKLYHLINGNKLVEKMQEDKKLIKFICKNKDYCKENTPRDILQYYKTPTKQTLDKQLKRINKLKLAREFKYCKETYSWFKVYAHKHINRTLDYIKDKGIHTYCDYIEACKILHLDFEDTKVLFPNDFQYYHDEYVKQANITKDLAQNVGLAKIYDKYSEFIPRTIANDYIIKIPKTVAEFIDEGEQNHNCVGKMGYTTKMSEDRCLICFMRKISEPSKSFITIELQKTTNGRFKIMQCYADHNSRPTEEINSLVEKWCKSIKVVEQK